MKNYLYYTFIKGFIFFLPVLVLMSSCKKIIEIPENPPSQITAVQVFSDSTNIMGAVAGAYSNFGAANYGIGTSIALYNGLSADELTTGQYTDPITAQFLNNGLIRDNTIVNQLWIQCYSNLYQINANIEGITSSGVISSGLKSRLLGEMMALRAFYYFNLVNIFDGVPIVLSSNYAETSKLPRASTQEVYAQIVQDLTQAQNRVGDSYPSAGRARVNRSVVRGLLAKVYLYQGNFQQAETLANQVISTGNYSLVADLNKVFLEGSSEAIWQLPANGLYSQTSDAQQFIPYMSGVSPNYPITRGLSDAFEAGDQRAQKWLAISDVDENGSGVLTRYYYPYKYKNRALAAATVESYMVLRLAELYLIRADARLGLGNLSGAMEDVNILRVRAGLEAMTGSISDVVASAILHERQTELFCEWGNRWFDLKKSGNIDVILGAEKPGWKATSALFPIPQEQLRLNPFLTQNLGY